MQDPYVGGFVDEIRQIQELNDDAICALATQLNNGRQCKVEHAQLNHEVLMIGGCNYHCRIRFLDGSPSWILRVQRKLPPGLDDYTVRSEFATLRFLEKTAVPTPRVYTYGLKGTDSERGLGRSFIMMEEMTGKPWRRCFGAPSTKEEDTKMWTQLADINIELEKYPFAMAGSLLLDEFLDPVVSAMASDRYNVLSPDGPWATAEDYYKAFVEQYMSLISRGEAFSSYSVNAYLIYRFLKDQVEQLLPPVEEHKFYLKHVDDLGHHILTDEDHNITALIDWQMARVVPKYEAFGPTLFTEDSSETWKGELWASYRR